MDIVREGEQKAIDRICYPQCGIHSRVEKPIDNQCCTLRFSNSCQSSISYPDGEREYTFIDFFFSYEFELNDFGEMLLTMNIEYKCWICRCQTDYPRINHQLVIKEEHKQITDNSFYDTRNNIGRTKKEKTFFRKQNPIERNTYKGNN